MSKTLIWVLVGVLAVASLGAVAFMGIRPHAEPAASTAPATPVGPSSNTAKAATVAVVEPAADTTNRPASAPVAAAPADAGTTPTIRATPTIDELIQNAAAYEGAAVSLSGTIVTQCTAGCEFALDDGTGVLSIQLEGKGKDRLIPIGRVGKKIAVQGVFHAAPRPQVVIEDPNGWQFTK